MTSAPQLSKQMTENAAKCVHVYVSVCMCISFLTFATYEYTIGKQNINSFVTVIYKYRNILNLTILIRKNNFFVEFILKQY